MRDVICDVINSCARSCDVGKIRVTYIIKVAFENQKKIESNEMCTSISI